MPRSPSRRSWYSYQWYADGKAIPRASKSAVALTTAQKGKKITVKVTAHRTGYKEGFALSAPTGVVVA
ncbi:glycoside hydrolase Chb [Streptomyces sp. V3I7]|uniref:glycoside hydrolase Chb n=1 Tax=Streptomyces sp. V3I7 TaxID=3042278 RepID=UPI0027862188|nr:glycoside hydrolase Chb [Streptomyces sp. V3I7]MDQ0991588.1 hypothetical protein [Streptomyces sp. V3I7]